MNTALTASVRADLERRTPTADPTGLTIALAKRLAGRAGIVDTGSLLAVRDLLATARGVDKKWVVRIDVHLKTAWLNQRELDLSPMTWAEYDALLVAESVAGYSKELRTAAAA